MTTRQHWINLGPSLTLAAGILLSTLIAVRAAAGWPVLAGPLVLALTLVGADVLRSRLQGRSSGSSGASLILGGSFLLAAWILTGSEPRLVATLLPILGAAAGVALLPARSRGRCQESSAGRR